MSANLSPFDILAMVRDEMPSSLVNADFFIPFCLSRKGNTLKNCGSEIHGQVVVITNSFKQSGNVILKSKVGEICALISQTLNDKTNWVFISPEFRDGKIVKISINDPALFEFKPYYAFE